MLFMGKCSKEDFAKNKKRFYLVGAVMLLIGFVSLSMPLLASFAVETVVGCLLLAVGFGSAFGAFGAVRSGDSPWQQAFMAVISIIAGIIFLTHPLAGVMTLSMLLSAYFLVDGVTKVIEYFRIREIGGSLCILLSGALVSILAFKMWKNFFTCASMIGIVLGIDLVFSGMSLILLGRGCSNIEKKM